MISVEQLREAHYRDYLAEMEVETVTPKADRDDYVHADTLDNARLIAELKGEPSQDLTEYLVTQTATHTIESLGAFDTQVNIHFDGEDLISFGERESVARKRAVLAAFAMQKADEGFTFYTRRTLAENSNKSAEYQIMREGPIGAARLIISPAEVKNFTHSRRLGMFPGREMAIMQISWKTAEDTMALRSVSLDRANLDIVRQHLERVGIQVPYGAEAEDFVGLAKELHFNSQDEIDTFVEVLVDRHDREVGKLHKIETKQGVTATDKRNLKLSLSDILDTGAGQLIVKQKIKLDTLISEHILHPKSLNIQIRHLAQQSIHKIRTDGTPLLNSEDRAAMRKLLATDAVDIDNETHKAAIENLIYIHSSAVEESYRKYLAGDKNALDWMLSDELGFAASVDAINSGTEAIENGRGSEACGLGSELGADGASVPPDAPLWVKYGWNEIIFDECVGCGYEGLVGIHCKFCNNCDTNDRLNPGYAAVMVQDRQRKKDLEEFYAKEKQKAQNVGRKTLFALAA